MAAGSVMEPQARPGPIMGRRRPGRGRAPAFALLALAGLLFLAFSGRIIGAPFGDSHDGRNAGVWAAGSRSLLDDGVVASRLGTRSPQSGVYANHPPLLYVETALFQAIGGSSAAVTRAPAWLGSLAALALLTALLLHVGLRPVAAGAAVALVAATPMLLTYGTMLDTPVTSLALGVAVLLLWERARSGRRVPVPLAAGMTSLAALSGWQSLLVAAVVGGWALVRLLRRPGRRRLDAAFVGGAAGGVVLLGGWLLWAFGGTLAPLLEQSRVRTGWTAPVPISELVATLAHDTGTLGGLMAVLAVPGLVVGMADRRTRGLVAVALAVTVPYPLVFRSGAVNHDYWNFWMLLPIAVGLAAGCDRLLRARVATDRVDVGVAAAAAAVAVVLTGTLWVRPNASVWAILEGRRAGSVAVEQGVGPAQRSAWYTGAVGRPATWLALATGRPAVVVPVHELPALAAAHPADVVFVGRMHCLGGAPRIAYAFETAGDLVDSPPNVARCAPPVATLD